MAFDESKHRRDTLKRFAEKEHSAAEESLPGDPTNIGARIAALPDATDHPPLELRANREGVAENLAAFGDYIDVFVDSVREGHLSRGVAGRDRVAAARVWLEEADAAAATQGGEAREFADGFRTGLIKLYRDHLPSMHPIAEEERDVTAELALVAAEKHRATKFGRSIWRDAMRQGDLHAGSPAEVRGMAVAAAALSGTDGHWGFRDRARDVICG